MEIGRLTEDDLPSLADLYREFWGEGSSLELMRVTFRRLVTNPNYIFLIAKMDERIAGSAMGIVCDELYGECKPFMVVEDVIVGKDFRRKGIGSLLMRRLEHLAAERTCNYIIFVTERERTEAHQFYESLGYKPDAYKGFKKRLAAEVRA
jgi:GNAT superfamily N-acetyltransferase